MRISRLLIANRGEIAVRIIRSAKDAGISTVAIYADQDRNAQFTSMADDAFPLNGTSANDTYLNKEKVLAIAQRSGANAVHPGYGFLSENADFAEMVIESGLLWIGPPPAAIRSLGNKISARQIAERAGAPLAPGTTNPVGSSIEVEMFAEQHGFPILIKAAHGGGGRGLRVVSSFDEIPQQFESATREANAAFGRPECFVEKLIEKPRHVETQCLADSDGNVVVISTRDCTIQRRHQKLIEEAPAPYLTKDQVRELYQSSKQILREVGYTGAGTCEFLIGRDGTIAFLEVNTRLQVEHTVSEQVSGIDLVREQFRIAEGELLGYSDPVIQQHSIEFRINAEDPGSGFLPSPGYIHGLRLPSGPNVRIDSGVAVGDTISLAFDSLLMKLIVTGNTRQDTIEKAKRALAELHITGIPTVIPFHQAILEEPAFCGTSLEEFEVYTTWVEDEFAQDLPTWAGQHGSELDEELYREIVVEVEGRRLIVGIPASIMNAGESAKLRKPPVRINPSLGTALASATKIVAPMQATIIGLSAAEGDWIEAGGLICMIEAMKMEQPITSPLAGRITSLSVTQGQVLKANDVVAIVEPEQT